MHCKPSRRFVNTLISIVFCILFLIFAVVFNKDDVSKTTYGSFQLYLHNDTFKANLISEISSASKSIKIVAQDLKFDGMDSDATELKEALKKASKKGVDIKLISTCNNSDVEGFLKCQKPSKGVFGTKIISDMMIIDNRDLFVIGTALPTMKNQIAFQFSDAPSIIDDVNAFFEFGWISNDFEYKEAHFPHKLKVSYNTRYPHDLKNLGRVSFIQSGVSEPVPSIREILKVGLDNIFDGSIKNLKYFGTRFDPHLSRSSNFVLQTIFASVASKGSVKIMLPLNEPTIKTSLKWLSTIAAYKNIEIRLTEENFTNNFIIADDYLLFSSHPFSDNMLYTSYGAELVIKNFVEQQKFTDIFDEYWNNSKTFYNYIDWIWN